MRAEAKDRGKLRLLATLALVCLAVLSAQGAGVPEPGITLYGTVYSEGTPLHTGDLTWTYTPQGGGSVEVTVPLQLISQGGLDYSYVAHIPAETPMAGFALSGQALVAGATAVGLLAAIPATIAYNTYASRIDGITSMLDQFTSQFEEDLQQLVQADEGEGAGGTSAAESSEGSSSSQSGARGPDSTRAAHSAASHVSAEATSAAHTPSSASPSGSAGSSGQAPLFSATSAPIPGVDRPNRMD